jgi:hypothetical protein
VKLFARRIHKNVGTESLTQGEVYANLAREKKKEKKKRKKRKNEKFFEVTTGQIGKPNTNGRMIVGS